MLLLQVREDIMEQSMVYEGYVKSEGIYQGEGRLLFKNGKCKMLNVMSCHVQICHATICENNEPCDTTNMNIWKF